MPELTSADVELFTHGRLSASDPEVIRDLNRAYAAIRKYCGWHVAPSKAEVVTLDGPNDAFLALPTLNLVTLTSVVEDGVTLNNGDLTPSSSGRLLVKRSGMRWSSNFRSIVVTMTHGFDVAPNFDQAVLYLVDEITVSASTGVAGGPHVRRDRVDDTEREWWRSVAAEALDINSVAGLLEQYRLAPSI
jgi:hypothetical protein